MEAGTTGPDRLPKTVYVRASWLLGPASDLIVLDETSPAVVSAKRTRRKAGAW